MFLRDQNREGSGRISLDKEQYIEDILENQHMSNCIRLNTPIPPIENFVKATDNDEPADDRAYRKT